MQRVLLNLQTIALFLYSPWWQVVFLQKYHSQWKLRIGDTSWKRFLVAFIGGFLVLIGARLAGGCTSGHMMSGMMQTSLSGYLFTLGAFVVAIPVSFLMFKGEK